MKLSPPGVESGHRSLKRGGAPDARQPHKLDEAGSIPACATTTHLSPLPLAGSSRHREGQLGKPSGGKYAVLKPAQASQQGRRSGDTSDWGRLAQVKPAAPLFLLLALLGACGAFHRNETVKSAKETVKALPDLVDSLKALVSQIGSLVAAMLKMLSTLDRDLVPPIRHVAEQTAAISDWVLYALVVGASGGVFSYGKTVVRVVKRLWKKATG